MGAASTTTHSDTNRRFLFCGDSMIKPNELGQAVTEADLLPFVNAQAPVYSQVIEELTAGCKRTHWMWFIFPQLRGLGHRRPPCRAPAAPWPEGVHPTGSCDRAA
jgi:hypothetical protein